MQMEHQHINLNPSNLFHPFLHFGFSFVWFRCVSGYRFQWRRAERGGGERPARGAPRTGVSAESCSAGGDSAATRGHAGTCSRAAAGRAPTL